MLVERRPQVHGFPHFDPLLQLRLLQLHANAVLQRAYASRTGLSDSTEMLPRSGSRSPSTHSIVVVLPAPLGPISPKISP